MSSTFLTYEEDAISALEHLRADSIDCVFTSPNPPQTDSDILYLGDFFAKFKPYLNSRGVIFVQISDYHDQKHGRLGNVPGQFAMLMEREGYCYRSRLFWHRLGDESKMEDEMRFRRDVEDILMFTHDRNHYFNDRLGMHRTSLISVPFEKVRKTEFKSGFPEEVVRRCIIPVTKPADVVLDPFTGTGTTGVACLKNGRHFIGFDNRKGFKAKIDNRLSKFGIKEIEVGDLGLQEQQIDLPTL